MEIICQKSLFSVTRQKLEAKMHVLNAKNTLDLNKIGLCSKQQSLNITLEMD